MIEAAERGNLKALYIMGENPMVTDPDTNHVRHCLQNLDLLVVQDIFLTETAQLADVVLPAACWAEIYRTGTTNVWFVASKNWPANSVGGCSVRNRN